MVKSSKTKICVKCHLTLRQMGRQLRGQMRLVSYSKQGRKVCYRLQDDHVFNFYQAVAEHLDEKE